MPAKKKSNAKGSTALKQIIRFAKSYQKEHPHAKWSSAVKAGGVEYRKKHKSKK